MVAFSLCSTTAVVGLSPFIAASSRQRMRRSVSCTLQPRRRLDANDIIITRTVQARAKSHGRDHDSLREPPPHTPLDAAVKETMRDGLHVLVVLDKLGARLYRTQMSSETPIKLEPLIHYNHAGEYTVVQRRYLPTHLELNRPDTYRSTGFMRYNS